MRIPGLYRSNANIGNEWEPCLILHLVEAGSGTPDQAFIALADGKILKAPLYAVRVDMKRPFSKTLP